MIRLALAALLLTNATPAPDPVEGQTPQAAARTGDLPYQLFVPRGYNASGKTEWPLMIFLHGSGERGADLAMVARHGPPAIVAKHPGFPFLLVSPQLEEGGDWDVARLDRLLADIRRRYRVDPSRIYLTGLSLGGIGTWHWAAARPDLFAAIAPVAGRADLSTACRLKDMPSWAFHGDNDEVVPPSGAWEMATAIRACPGRTATPRLTVYPNTDHWSWVPAYDDDGLYRWLLEQRRAVPAPR